MDGCIASQVVARRGPGQPWHDVPISLGESTFLKGCNIYHVRSVIRQSVSAGAPRRAKLGLVTPEFKKAFVQRFLRLPRFAPTHGEPRDIEERLLRSATAGLENFLLEAILAIETAAAFKAVNFDPITFFMIDHESDHFNLVWETASPKLSRHVAELAFIGVLELLQHRTPALHGLRTEFEAGLEALLEAARKHSATHTASLMKYVARQRGLPAKLLSREQVRIGQGRAQRHIEASMTDATSAVAHRCCWDKRLASRRMAELGLPVPMQLKARTVAAAREAADRLGFPVVLKPVKGSGGQGVTSDITTYEGLEAAFVRAKRPKQDVLIEEYVPGFLHRLLVIGGRFVGAVRCSPPTITGDGERTVRELIAGLNADPRRNGMIMGPVEYDDEVERMLKRQGHTLDSVLTRGARCSLRLVANIGMGSVSEDCTDHVHEDNRELAERAAKCLFLDVGGIDFITPDISLSFQEVGGRIIEVNTRPGLLTHMWPAKGKSRNFAAKILESVYPPGENGRIPVVVTAGDRGTGTVARTLDRLLRDCRTSTGLWSRKAAYIDGKICQVQPEGKHIAPTALLSDPGVEVLVSAMSLRRIVQRGMDLDWCSVAVILDPNKEGNAEQFAAGVAVLERATAEVFIVGIGNRPALQHLDNLGRRKLILVGERIGDPMEQDHLGRGGTVIADGRVNGEDCIILMTGKRSIAHFPLGEASAQLTKGQQRRMRQVTRYAIAAAFATGISVADIQAAAAGSQVA